MANPGLEAAYEAIELDAFSKDIPNLIPHNTTLYGIFKNHSTTIPVSNITAAGGVTRPSFRVPLRVQAGAAIFQATGNADSIGRGTASSYAAFALSPVFFTSVCEISYLSRAATNGQKRGLFNVQAQELQNTFAQAQQGLEALLQGDGSGTLDQIPATATINNGTGPAGPMFSSIVGLNNAFQFTDQQTIQVWSSLGGTNRGTFVVSYVDPVAQTVYSSAALPVGTTTGDLLIVAGAPGTAGGSILGLRAWQVNSNSGTLAGLNRASFPGRLSTPTINLNGGVVNLGIGYRAIALLGRALGPQNEAIKKALFYCGPDQATQIANQYFQVQIADQAHVTGDTSPDMVKKFWNATFCGRQLEVGWNALPGRLDLFTPATWYTGEMIPLELYDFGGGITIAPVPDISSTSGNNSYLFSNMFAYVAALNIANSNPRAGVYIQNAGIPSI